MKIAIRILKITGLTILALVCLIGVYLLSAYVLSRISVDRESQTQDDIPIYILTNGVHTDLVLPIKNEQIDWSKEVKFANTVSKDSLFEYVAFGWGDKGFYLETPTWADLKASVAFKAAFALSTSAIHATFYKSLREGSDCVKINISREQYSRLVKYIQDSFITDAQGHLMYIQTNANYGKEDAFYEAKGRYNIFHTCNTWANNGLKSCGQKASLWTPFDTGIFYQYTSK
ncbi:TIGR02117 family protein [Emticicia agri]|uniref:TIGR02117 family protein n=1 Tax=Emticicia agri TaxID=2492393 RepID=UPI001A9207EC|nr:TIGR02117 family protein [Emticicia agri]